MTNVLEAVSSILKTFVDEEPKLPINVNEVSHVWKYLAFIEETIVLEQISANTTTDVVLIELLDEAIKLCGNQSEHLQRFMKDEGIPIPDLPVDKPKSDPHAVTMGTRMTDDEISNIMSAKLLLAVTECSRGLTESVRNDIGLMWANFFYEHCKFGAVLKTKMREKGWLKMPPAYIPPGAPVQ